MPNESVGDVLSDGIKSLYAPQGWQKSHDCINPAWSDSQKRAVIHRWEFEKQQLRILIPRYCELFGGNADEKVAKMEAAGRLECGDGYYFFAKKLKGLK